MSNDGQSKDNLEENPRASDEDDSSWTPVVSKSKKKSQSQLQYKSSNSVGANTGAPGASWAQRTNNSNPTTALRGASSSDHINRTRGSSFAPGSSSASQPGSQTNSSNPVAPSAANSTQVRGQTFVPPPSSSTPSRGLASQGSQPSSQSNFPSSSASASTSSNTQNNPVDLCCNHFEVQFRKQPLPIIHHYNVTINSKRYSSSTQDTELSSEVKSRGLKLKIFDALRNGKPELSRCAYDGASDLFSARLLSDILNDPNEVLIPRNVNPGWRPENRAETSRQPEELVYVVTITQSQANPRDGSTFPSQHTRHGEPGPNDKIFLQALSLFLVDSSATTEGVERRLCVRSNYYSRPEVYARQNVSNNVVVWEGFHSSFRLTYATPDAQVPRLVLNYSDVMTAVLVSKPVEDFIGELLWANYRRDDIEYLATATAQGARNMVNTALSGVRVQTTCEKYVRNYTIRELTLITSIDHRFQVTKRNENGEIWEETVNVGEHFLSRHGYTLLHPRWPLLCMKGPRENGPVYIPIEVCTILDRQRYMRFSPDERTRFLNFGKISPGRKKINIENSLNTMAATYEAHDEPLGESFGIQIQRSMMNVQGQVLAAPTLYFQDSSMDMRRSKEPGQWNFISQRMQNPVKLNDREWAVYVFLNNSGRTGYNSNTEDLIEYYQGEFLFKSLSEMFRKMGMLLQSFPPWYLETRDNANLNPEERIQRMLNTVQLPKNLIVAVLPSKSPELYVPLKKICETTADGGRTVITQCVIMGKRPSLGPQHLANLALKINLKMGGNNSNVGLEAILGSKPTCIFGIDVSHGSTKDTDKPSIAAVVASVEDNIWSRYAPQVREQTANQEEVQDLQDMVTDLLREFGRNNKQYPGQIIVYRDGVSESQFETVGRYELDKFKEAVDRESRGLKIPITFIIVQKRHHTRFFKRRQGETFENMKPGTVVTSQVCQTQNQDFYLCSHQSFIRDSYGGPGVTSRPAHYTVYSDEIHLGQANIHNLTNYLCYCFGRATTAVSIPAPVYYAHVAAKHYSSFMSRNAAGGATLRNINDKLKTARYRMFYI